MSRPRIQDRIKLWLLKRIINPWQLIICSIAGYTAITLILEILGNGYSYINALNKLDYEKIRELVNLIVTTDGIIIAFTGVITSTILRDISEKEKSDPRSEIQVKNLVKKSKDHVIMIPRSWYYREKREDTILFILLILLSLISSIWFSLVVIVTQFFPLLIVSIIFMFIGLIELMGMIIYPLLTKLFES